MKERVFTVVKGRNADVIAAAARLYAKPGDRVLDATYGRGLWWTKYRPERLVAHDKKRDGVDFRALPYDDDVFDLGAFDPPYISTGNRETSTIPGFYDAYGLGELKGWASCFDLATYGLCEYARVVRPGGFIWVKTMDFVESGQKRWGHRHVLAVADRLGLKQEDEFIHDKGPGPQPLHGREQKHAHAAHSFLVVLRKPKRRR
jgi:hypothetical protein